MKQWRDVTFHGTLYGAVSKGLNDEIDPRPGIHHDYFTGYRDDSSDDEVTSAYRKRLRRFALRKATMSPFAHH